jgi:tRNA-binding EMAP/Myf-like protein
MQLGLRYVQMRQHIMVPCAVCSLYVEEVDIGEEEPRQVVSGLVKFMSEVGSPEICKKHTVETGSIEGIDEMCAAPVIADRSSSVEHQAHRLRLQDKMLGARVVIVANMKPANMRGIKSHAMVLCASSTDGAQVSFCAAIKCADWPTATGCQLAVFTVVSVSSSMPLHSNTCRWSLYSRQKVPQWVTASQRRASPGNQTRF